MLGPEFKPQYCKVYIYIFSNFASHRWLTPIILAAQEAEIRRIEVRSQAGGVT
jgi:hypothetical protein